jgi:predicted alpha-1,2-mannosidase
VGEGAVLMRRLLCIVGLLGCGNSPQPITGPPTAATPDGWARYVNAFIGTADGAPDYGITNQAGDTFVGAVLPFGLVQLGPDTTNAPGGYRYTDSAIRDFSVTHFSGRGVSCYQDFPIIPTIGPISALAPDAWSAQPITFRHENEVTWPGYYGVRLDSGIAVELTATARSGFLRLQFPPTDAAMVIVNAGGSVNGDNTPGTGLTIAGDRTLLGSAVSGYCGEIFTYKVYFAARFDRAFSQFGGFTGDSVEPNQRQSSGTVAGAYVSFDTRAQSTVLMKVGVSFVSAQNALANLDAENPDWDFDQVRDRALAAWNARLGAVAVDGGSDTQTRIFYTALYHAHIHPSLFSDANGEYLGFDQQVHNTQTAQYHNISTWDAYRSQLPLVALLAPAEAGAIAQSLVNDSTQDPGGGLPRWEHANTNSGGMLGDGPTAALPVLGAFGASFDSVGALAAMKRDASVVGTTSAGHEVREGLADYLAKGWVTTATMHSVARTLEYVNDDFALSQFAAGAGDAAAHDLYVQRSHQWRKLLNAGYLAPRDPDGSFPSFDPNGFEGYIEGDGAQYVWLVPFDYRGLFDALGGNDAVIARLDHHFTKLNEGPRSEFAFMGNEPELKAPWAYAFAGAPHKTQALVRRILTELYKDAPNGMPGNDDGGAMGSWVVFASIGLFPEIPGVPGFVVGSPIFDSITLQLPSGASLQINATGAAPDAPYVQSLKLNGQDYASPWIPWSAIKDGATLDFVLGNVPNQDWGSDPSVAPPSFE